MMGEMAFEIPLHFFFSSFIPTLQPRLLVLKKDCVNHHRTRPFLHLLILVRGASSELAIRNFFHVYSDFISRIEYCYANILPKPSLFLMNKIDFVVESRCIR